MKPVTFKDFLGYIWNKLKWVLLISLILCIVPGLPVIACNLGYDYAIEEVKSVEYKEKDREVFFVQGEARWGSLLFGKDKIIHEMYIRVTYDDNDDTYYWIQLPEMERFDIHGSTSRRLESARSQMLGEQIMKKIE